MLRTVQVLGPRPSNKAPGKYWQIDFVDILSGAPYTTYVHNRFQNFRSGYWHEILQNPHNNYIIENYTMKNLPDGRTIVNADSEPQILFSGTPEEIDQIQKQIGDQQ
jgi:hypothetical protein